MTPKNHGYYLVLWGAVRKVRPKADRHALHVEALGYDRSSKDFTPTEFRKVKNLFQKLANAAPDTHEEEHLRRYRFALRRYAAAVDGDDAWLMGILKEMGRIGGLRTWVEIDEQSLEVLEKILIAVKKEARRRWKDKDALWVGLSREWMDQDIDNEAAEATVREILKCTAIPNPDKWSYEDMLAVLGATKRRALQTI